MVDQERQKKVFKEKVIETARQLSQKVVPDPSEIQSSFVFYTSDSELGERMAGIVKAFGFECSKHPSGLEICIDNEKDLEDLLEFIRSKGLDAKTTRLDAYKVDLGD